MDIITCSPQLSRSAMPHSFAGVDGIAEVHASGCAEPQRSWRDLHRTAAGAPSALQGQISTIQDDIAVYVDGYDATFDKFPITMGSPPPRPPV